ncbi:MAG: GDP-mannose 4,6-dehydratase [Candidatus Acidiferrales bacterium]|jgi:GDPmannose 4,6-dehydratase
MSIQKRALITGISGQDGSYLAEFLLDKGYEVHGIVRRVAMEDPQHRLSRIYRVRDQLQLHAASLESYPSLMKVVAAVRPDEVYHLAAQSYVSYSFEDEFSTFEANVNGTHYMLSACRDCTPKTRFYFAGSSEMFGAAPHPQNELTSFRPRSVYGISKVAGYHMTRNYREAYGLHASCGMMYNHESPRRGMEFVTRKISTMAAQIKLGLAQEIRLGNLEAKRDWGYAGEYVEAMWLMMQQEQPDDYVIATEETHSVREFLECAFGMLDLDPYKYLVLDSALARPAEVDLLLGDMTKARQRLQWSPRMHFRDLVHTMVNSDLQLYSRNEPTAGAAVLPASTERQRARHANTDI